MGPQGHHNCEKLLLKALLVFPFIKQSEEINQKSIYRRHTASNNRFGWPVCPCDYFIFHANLNTREKRAFQPRAHSTARRLSAFVIIHRLLTFILWLPENYIPPLKRPVTAAASTCSDTEKDRVAAGWGEGAGDD